jgi:dihydroxyacetone kinase-like predicted kinase
VDDMTEAMDDVETGEITIATRSVEIDGVKVKQGEIIGLLNGKLISASKDLLQACLKLFEQVDFDNYELVTLFFGNNLNRQQVEVISDEIRARYPGIEIEIQDGGQPHYYFIISIE